MTPEDRLFAGIIDNAVDASLNPKDEYEQEMAKWFFYTDTYETLYFLLYDVSGDGFLSKMESLWEDIEKYPRLAPEYRHLLRKSGVNMGRNRRLHTGKSSELSDEWRENNAKQTRDEMGRYQ